MNTKVKDWLFKTKQGDYVYYQKPNIKAYSFILSIILALFFSNQLFGILVGLLALWWGFDELLYGVNNSRKVLGIALAAVAVWIFFSKVFSGGIL